MPGLSGGAGLWRGASAPTKALASTTGADTGASAVGPPGTAAAVGPPGIGAADDVPMKPAMYPGWLAKCIIWKAVGTQREQYGHLEKPSCDMLPGTPFSNTRVIQLRNEPKKCHTAAQICRMQMGAK